MEVMLPTSVKPLSKWLTVLQRTTEMLLLLLPFDEAVASIAVVVIASGSDGRASERKRLLGLLNNSKR